MQKKKKGNRSNFNSSERKILIITSSQNNETSINCWDEEKSHLRAAESMWQVTTSIWLYSEKNQKRNQG